MKNPIIERELIGVLRTKKALALELGVSLLFALLVVLRWPSDALVDLNGHQARQVFDLFGYGLLTTLILLVPIFPATSIVKEKVKGTLALLLNSPMSAPAIYFGKLIGVLGFVVLLLVLSLPAAAACFAMGGISGWNIALLYVVLLLVAVQYAAMGLLVSSYAGSTDTALRMTYGAVLLMAVVSIGPHTFLQGTGSSPAHLADWLRCLSPVPAVMELLGHGDVGTQGLIVSSSASVPLRYIILAVLTTAGFIGWTISRLNYSIFDRSRSQGIITDDRDAGTRVARRLFFLIDPQRRKGGIGPLTNPVMVKEFRCRRFGRSHWMMRLILGCMVFSLLLTFATTLGSMDWGVNFIGGLMVILQVALIVLLTPSLAAGLISAERESGGWTLLQMTPLSAGKIIRGKLLSVLFTLALILCATLPGYLVIIWIRPSIAQQVMQVLVCLVTTAVFAVLVTAAVSSLFARTAPATTVAYTLLVGLCVGTMLVWLGRDTRFSHSTVETVLTINPMAAALNIIEAPGFADYQIAQANMWFVGYVSLAAFCLLLFRTWQLTRPQ